MKLWKVLLLKSLYSNKTVIKHNSIFRYVGTAEGGRLYFVCIFIPLMFGNTFIFAASTT